MTFDFRHSKADFPMWDELELFRLNGCKPKVLERKLIAAARLFVPYPIRYDTVDAPYGGYYFTFAVEIEQELRWNFPEFQAGREFGRALDGSWFETNKGSPRDVNPYACERARHRSWDCGYVLGCYERTLVTEAS
jgi:hypothetical protein